MLYRAVKFATATPVRYVQYPGEGHGNRSNVYQYDYALRTLRWFDHYLAPGQGRSAAPPPFLCFQRRSEGDVVIGDWKIAGSAQRRRRGAILQHGSILLGTSRNAPELQGIREVARIDLQPFELVAPWVDAIGNLLSLLFAESKLSESETEAARKIERRRFATNNWTRKR